jgi:hypothetical protein
MIITEPNAFVAEVHDRMPVLLTEPQFAVTAFWPRRVGPKAQEPMTTPRRFPPPWNVEEMTSLRLSPRPVRPEGGELCQ